MLSIFFGYFLTSPWKVRQKYYLIKLLFKNIPRVSLSIYIFSKNLMVSLHFWQIFNGNVKYVQETIFTFENHIIISKSGACSTILLVQINITNITNISYAWQLIFIRTNTIAERTPDRHFRNFNTVSLPN